MIHVEKLENGKYRVVRGELLKELSLDWSVVNITELRKMIEFALTFDSSIPLLKKYKGKKINVYEGGNHLVLVEHNKGDLGLLRVEDHNHCGEGQ